MERKPSYFLIQKQGSSESEHVTIQIPDMESQLHIVDCDGKRGADDDVEGSDGGKGMGEETHIDDGGKDEVRCLLNHISLAMSIKPAFEMTTVAIL